MKFHQILSVLLGLLSASSTGFAASLNMLRTKRSSDIPPQCLQPPETGHCLAYFLNFYYNAATEQCETFVYGGCGGNGNNFYSRGMCEAMCAPRNDDEENYDFDTLEEELEALIEEKDDCEYPPETGECRALFYRYYFNGEKCEEFVYGGCGGNPNNFRTEEDCIDRCMKKDEDESDNEV